MNKSSFIFASLLLTSCQSSENHLTEEQASNIIIEHHGGTVEIVSVTKEWNKYIVAWETEDKCERGIDSVNKNGEIKNLGSAIC
ncbi:hypothetical protein LCL96_16085 [Rossellomorea aquimaris]|uniref:hypothetical protein n=1 Tax=Rossellomorea aquimaris TaxID=189382 RepID=UPI001CD24858|nr:hypothetical protein [Rossellomorea aquimaris]MCA1060458.1 hypothetical protein [Rossellomorea aquimaris]